MMAALSLAEEQAVLRTEIEEMESSLAMRLAAGELGVHPKTYAHQARVVRQARARLLTMHSNNAVGEAT